MMLPGHPPPTFSRAPLRVSESPRAAHTNTFNQNHLSLPTMQSNSTNNAPRSYGQSGPILAPIAIPGTIGRGVGGSGGGAGEAEGGRPLQHLHQHHRSASRSRLPHVQLSPGPFVPQPDHNSGGFPTSKFDQFLPDRAPFASPASSFSSPAPLNFDQRGNDFRPSRPFNTESSPGPRVEVQGSMIPSPTYTVKRSPDHISLSEESYQPPSRFTPNSIDETTGIRREPPHNPRCRIIVRQQPVAARACGFGERDRRVIDPPPIVELRINDPVTGDPDKSEIKYPFHVVHCTLWNIDGTTDETALTSSDKLTRRLMGTLVSSPFVGTDENNKEGCFFCFPDLSCRTHGKYRLRFVLMRLEPSNFQPQGYTPIIAICMSEVFQVYTAKDFPGMRPSTQLTKALKKQGCAISVKKGNEKATGSGKGDKDGVSGDDGELSPSQSTNRPKRRRKG